MTILESRQVSSVDWMSDADCCFICATGYESRATFAASVILKDAPKCELHAFGFPDRKVLARPENDDWFRHHQFRIDEDVSPNDGAVIVHALTSFVAKATRPEVVFVFDYSCMVKPWYGDVLRALSNLPASGKEVSVYFTYSPASFTPPGPPGSNRVAGAMRGFFHLAPPMLPTALILGLGYEAVRALGLRDYLDPKATFAFYSEPALEPAFSETVVKNNQSLLNSLTRSAIFTHPLADLDYTSALLKNLTESLIGTYRVVIAPLGPKPFAFLSFFLATSLKQVDVWRVSAAEHGEPEERSAVGRLLIYKVRYG